MENHRITARFGLEGALRMAQFHPPAVAGTPPRVPAAPAAAAREPPAVPAVAGDAQRGGQRLPQRRHERVPLSGGHDAQLPVVPLE